MYRKNGARRGFTLIELLIVVAIIAVLSSIVLIGLGPTQRAGRDARRIADLRQVQTALELYFNKCGYYPGQPQPVSPCGPFTAITTWQDLVFSLRGSNVGVNQVPNDPTSGRTYSYGTDLSGSSYILGSSLEDQNSSALVDDIDGFVNGVDCTGTGGTDTVYCIQL